MEIGKFRTLMCVTFGIVNRRPLTRPSSDLKDIRPLRRSHDTLRPIIDDLWKRFRSEYVSELQRRTKWISTQRNLAKGDLVLVIDELFPREQWPMAVIMDTFPSDDGLVRRVLVKTVSQKILERDVRKIVLLEREGEGEKVEEMVKGGGAGDGDSDSGGSGD